MAVDHLLYLDLDLLNTVVAADTADLLSLEAVVILEAVDSVDPQC